MPPLLMRRPRWRSGSSAQTTLGVVAAAALVVVLCLLVGSRRRTGAGSTASAAALASDFGRRTTVAAAAAGARPGGDRVLLTEMKEQELEQLVHAGAGRRLLSGGPGSHPPRCTSKCGSCSPCYPVHVSVPPGVLVTTEYYPEAWRCKCRNQLYMP